MKHLWPFLVLIAIAIAGCTSPEVARVNAMHHELAQMRVQLDSMHDEIASLKMQVAKATAEKAIGPDATPEQVSNLEAERDFDPGPVEPDESEPKTETARSDPPEADVAFVGSSRSDKFHRLSCRSANRISSRNLVGYSSREEAISAGRVPCKVCNP